MPKNFQSGQTPNQKFNAEFGQENVKQKVQKAAQNKVQENYKTPDEKFNSEFAVEDQGLNEK